ncbi:hypothetical protein KBC55_04615 [Patescibacteria group bacterium]|nr:hypothetical protein [Patescibacteria group bacterium]
MFISKRLFAGSLLIIAPWLLLLSSIIGYAIASFVISAVVGAQSCMEVYYVPEQNIQIECGGGDVAMMIGSLIRIALGAFGIVGVVGILVGNPFGLYLLFTAMTTDQKKGSKK